MEEGRQSRVRCNIERTASGKVVRAITYEHIIGEEVTQRERESDIEQTVALFLHLEAELQRAHVTE